MKKVFHLVVSCCFWEVICLILLNNNIFAQDNALDFGGNTTKRYVYGYNIFVLGNNPRTLEAWVYPRTFAGGGVFQSDNGNTEDGREFALRTVAPDNTWRVDIRGLSWDISLPNTKNTWNHVALVFDGINIKLYLNGNLVFNQTRNLNTDEHSLLIGEWDEQYFDGIIDEVRFWNVARTQEEIQKSMYSELSLPQPGLKCYYKMNEGSGTTTLNAATGSNDAIRYSQAWVPGFTSSFVPPTVTTQAVTDITTTTATGNGNVTNLGVPNPTQYGVCWGISADPTILSSRTEQGAKSETGTFTSSMTGLTPGTLYHVRAYATNNKSTAYGSDVQFTALKTPTVTTQAVTSITTTTAVGNGNVTDLGVPNPTQYGVCWSTSANPTIDLGTKTTQGAKTTTGTFTSNITGLTPGTLYHVRAYATNDAGTAYGSDVQFTALKTPTVTTQEVTSITTTTAVGNGNVTNLGVPNPTQYGVCWNTSGNPTTANSKTLEGIKSATGAFTSNITGLTPGTLYHVRAYATNDAGTAYGSDVQFTAYKSPTVTTQEVTSITTTTAVGNGNVTNLGVPNPTQYGVCWNTSGNPTTANSKTLEGTKSATGAFTSNITGLTAGTTYHVRAYATNSAGTSYGEDVQFTALNTPTVTTQAVTAITTTTATGNGSITNLGVPNPTQYGVCWSTSENPTIALSTRTEQGAKSATGTFTSSITGLTPGTLYHVRAYATNSVGTTYGSDVQFTALNTPTVTTQAVTSITGTTAMGNGNVTYLGVPNPTQYGVCWSISENPTIALSTRTEQGAKSVTGTFTSSITGLTPGTLYHVRAYATNSAGTCYGEDVQFTALNTPTVTTQAVTSITTTTAVGNGNVTYLGVPNPTQYGVCWNTSGNPTTANSKTQEGTKSATGAFTSSITGLTAGTTYHVRAYAINSVGTVYGEDVQFTTSYILPTVTTQAVTAITTTTATGNGSVTNLGVPNPTQYGVCWSTSENPTIALSTRTEQGAKSATGAFTSNITGLTPGTLYHVRAYATNNAGTAYGEDVQFTALNTPTVTTQAVTNITGTTATGNGNITDLGLPNPTQYGVCWSTSENPTVALTTKTELGAKSATGAFTSSLEGLQLYTTYYLRAYATNSAGTAYGEQVQFTTNKFIGSGTSTDPYLISTLAQLKYASEFGTDQSYYYKQTVDIDATATETWNSGTGWIPFSFIKGGYDGNGHTINNLFINRPNSDNQGFLGSTRGFIKNVGLVNVRITGRDGVGALCGRMYNYESSVGTIDNCFATGIIKGNMYVGGLAGSNVGGKIRNSYSRCEVVGSDRVGGLSGNLSGRNVSMYYSLGEIDYCYSTGKVTGNSNVGGLVGYNYNIDCNTYSSYWNTETSTLTTSPGGGSGRTTAQMKVLGNYTGWNFGDTWKIEVNKNGDYPYLGWQVFSPPAVQASNIIFSSVTSCSITITWTNGDGGKRAVFMKQSNTGNAVPSDYTTYSANTTFRNGSQIGSTGWYCIYNGKGTSVTVDGLSLSTQYIVQVCEYNYDGGCELYKTTSAANNPNVQQTNALTIPTTQANSITFPNIVSTAMTIGWTSGNGEKRAVFIKQGTTGTTAPSDNVTYTPGTIFGSGTTIGSSNWYCIYNGTGTNVTVTGLTLSTDYTVQVFEYSGAPGNEKYLASTASNNPKSQTTSDFVNYALSFDGGDYVSLPAGLWNSNFSNQTAITIEYWFKGTNLSCAYRAEDPGSNCITGWGSNILHLISSDGGSPNGISAGTPATINNNQWHHIAMTWQRGGKFTSYLDGVQVAQRDATTTSNLPNITSNSYLGANNGTSEFLNGALDEIRFWNTARTAQQINDYKNIELAGNESGLIAYYKMSNGSGTSLTDNAGNTYTGTLGASSANPTWIILGAPVTRVIPTLQAHSILFSDKTETGMTVSWTIGNGAKRAVFIKQGNSGSTTPADNTTYTANPIFGSGTQIGSTGWFCVYNGTGSNVSITGLTASTDYVTQVFEYNDEPGHEKYFTVTASGNPSSDSPLPVVLTSFSASVNNGKVVLNWQTATEVNNYGFEVERSTVISHQSSVISEQSTSGGNPQSEIDNPKWEKIGFVEGNGNSNSPKEYGFVDESPVVGNLQYRLKQIDTDGNYKYYSNIAEVNFNVTDVKEKQLPKEFSLSQNYPNPFNPATKIQYQIPSAGAALSGGIQNVIHVKLSVYNILGHEVATLVNKEQTPGYYEVTFDASGLSTGVYIYKLTAGSFSSIKKLMLIK